MWTGLTAKSLKALTSLKSYPKTPTASYIIDQFSTPKDKGLKYGQRLHGYFAPPESGNYIFAASCTDECKLFLSKTDDEEKKDVIITHEAGSAQDQSSDPVQMKGGHTYFIEALSYHDAEDSPMKVGVRLPSGKILAPIPSQYLKLERGAMIDEEYDAIPEATIRSLFTHSAFPAAPTKWRSLSEFNMQENGEEGNHGHRISGYFFAKETGKYKFFGTCPNGCRLYLSDDDTCNKRSLVLDYNSPFAQTRSLVNRNKTLDKSNETERSGKSWNVTTRNLDLPSLFEVSKTFELNSGLYYYIEALQVTKGNQANSVKVGVEQPSGKTYFPIKKDLLKQFTPSKHGIVREIWKNLKGENIRDLTTTSNYPMLPAEVDLLSDFDAPANERYNYGQRLKGYFVAPMTGDYRFVISCDRKCDFFMSSNEKPEHKKRMLRLTKKTAKHQFDKYPEEQLSQAVHLDIGEQYYIEAVHKASTGLDHLSLGVTLPTGSNEWPIPKKYLRFRPKDTGSSPITAQCNYNLNDGNPSTRTAGAESRSTESLGRTTQNDIAILNGEDAEEHGAETLQNKNNTPQSLSSVTEHKNLVGELETATEASASTKVKVTRLELPFGTGDSKSAAEALNVMNKIKKMDKDKLKLKKNDKGKGFTLTGLPGDLNKNDVAKIAKGVASVIESEGSGEEMKNDSLIPDKLKLVSEVKNPQYKVVDTGSNPESAKALPTKNEASSNPVITSPPAVNNPNQVSNVHPTTVPALDIESVNVVGNLADTAKLGDLDLLKNPSLQRPKVNSEQQVSTASAAMISTSSQGPSSAANFANLVKQKAAHQRIQQGSVLEGDSIGTPVSDIMPGLNEILAGPHSTNSANSQEPHASLSPASHYAASAAGGGVPQSELPINKLTDYDILDVDLEGLKGMKKIPSDNGVAKFMDEKPFSQSDLPSGFEDASFVGDRINTEANEMSNLVTMKKKKIPKAKTINFPMLKRSLVNGTPIRTLVKKRGVLGKLKSLTGKSVVVKANSSVTVTIKHDKNKPRA